MRALLVLVAATLVLGACGGDDNDAFTVDTSADDTTTTTITDPDTPVSSPDLPDPGPSDVPQWQRTEPQPGAIGIHTIAFDPGQAEATGDGLLVRFYGGIEPCSVLDRAEVVETAATVTITLYGGSPPSAASATCIDIAVGYEVLILLDAPFGDRTLIDGSV